MPDSFASPNQPTISERVWEHSTSSENPDGRSSQSVKPGGYVAVSDLVCKKLPLPREIGIFFEEPDEPPTLESTRDWYKTRGMRIVREVECSQEAWMDYYDMQGEMLTQISRRPGASRELLDEVEKERVEEGLVRKHREEYMNYVTFVMRKL
jgi:hypothetical protein